MLIRCNLCDKTREVPDNLTKKQMRVLNFITEFKKKNRIIPSVREIVRGLDYKSTSIVAFHLDALIAKQYLARKPYHSRSLVILKDLCA
ncbi:MAG: hypothetical protein QGH27_03070 [SAR324 cluster bacterium]|jgi:SOS-response transcriptional repressor LexA|nr:hypothetical protein [SAR324 cluster bacterium]|tara:strand:- start:23 stop:289 length:267 start_codon:yes stop_codon:yes gene_type:complete